MYKIIEQNIEDVLGMGLDTYVHVLGDVNMDFLKHTSLYIKKSFSINDYIGWVGLNFNLIGRGGGGGSPT